MEEVLYEAPLYWISETSAIPECFKRRYKWRDEFEDIREGQTIRLGSRCDYYDNDGTWWYKELFYAKILQKRFKVYAEDPEFNPDLSESAKGFESPLAIVVRILIQVLSIPKDCKRALLRPQDVHQLCFFTNHRTIQISCCHNSSELRLFAHLWEKDAEFHELRTRGELKQHNHKTFLETKGENGEPNYENFTELAFLRSRPFVVSECIYPEGIDMEALSPRDANAHMRVHQPAAKQAALKSKPSSKLTQKEKDHPPPPPVQVVEPPSTDRKNGAVYQTGKCLGKGGFAICYEAHLAPSKHRYALKIVKSHMPQKKMEQKVCACYSLIMFLPDTQTVHPLTITVSNRTSNPFQDAPCQYR